MSTPKLTIDKALEAFLADQKSRLSARTFDRYETSIHLFKSYLEGY